MHHLIGYPGATVGATEEGDIIGVIFRDCHLGLGSQDLGALCIGATGIPAVILHYAHFYGCRLYAASRSVFLQQNVQVGLVSGYSEQYEDLGNGVITIEDCDIYMRTVGPVEEPMAAVVTTRGIRSNQVLTVHMVNNKIRSIMSAYNNEPSAVIYRNNCPSEVYSGTINLHASGNQVYMKPSDNSESARIYAIVDDAKGGTGNYYVMNNSFFLDSDDDGSAKHGFFHTTSDGGASATVNLYWQNNSYERAGSSNFDKWDLGGAQTTTIYAEDEGTTTLLSGNTSVTVIKEAVQSDSMIFYSEQDTDGDGTFEDSGVYTSAITPGTSFVISLKDGVAAVDDLKVHWRILHRP